MTIHDALQSLNDALDRPTMVGDEMVWLVDGVGRTGTVRALLERETLLVERHDGPLEIIKENI